MTPIYLSNSAKTLIIINPMRPNSKLIKYENVKCYGAGIRIQDIHTKEIKQLNLPDEYQRPINRTLKGKNSTSKFIREVLDILLTN